MRRPLEGWCRAPTLTWRGWPNRYCWVPVATKVTSSDASHPGRRRHKRGGGQPRNPHVDGCHLRHGPGGRDHPRSGIPVAHAPVGVHGARGGCVHHRSASPQGAGGPVPWHQGADITSGQPARTELDSGGAAAAATPSWGSAPLGDEVELALGGGPARGAALCRGPCNGPACPSRPTKGARHPLGAGG